MTPTSYLAQSSSTGLYGAGALSCGNTTQSGSILYSLPGPTENAPEKAPNTEPAQEKCGFSAAAEVGKLYIGMVKKIMDFGAFVEIFPGVDGLVHVSELDREPVKSAKGVLRVGDRVLSKCIGIDQQGRIKLSRRQALELACA